MTDSSAGATVAAATAVDPAAAVVVGGAVAVAADSDVAVVVECGRAPLKSIPKTWRACATRCATSPIRPSA